jgi:CheY-like chemotaxis protein
MQEGWMMDRKPHVLLAEDELYVRLTVSFALEEAGMEVTAVDNGARALEHLEGTALQERPVDLLITDLQMPCMTGMELIRRLREKGLKVPILVLSAWATREMLARIRELWSVDFLEKPFEAKDLMVRVNHLLQTPCAAEPRPGK